jgi:N-acylglucosamine-6-phosphate 2-epimerase
MVERMSRTILDGLKGGLVVSCQAPEGSPLRDPYILGRIAAAAEDAGAVAIRAEGLASIEAIRKEVSVPVIGLIKRSNSSPVYITPDLDDVRNLVEAGADIVAVDATERLREGGVTSANFIAEAVASIGSVPIMADVDSLSSAVIAAQAGAQLVGTTLSGYTGGEIPVHPDIDLVREIASVLQLPIIAEGRYSSAEDVQRALDYGAHAVCIGTSLTDPWTLTKRLVAKIR